MDIPKYNKISYYTKGKKETKFSLNAIRFRPEGEPEDVFEMSIFNLKAYMGTTKKKFRDEILWENTIKQSYRKSGTRKSSLLENVKFFNKKSSLEFERMEVRSKGVCYLEKSRFEDLLFSVGDIDVFMIPITLLTQHTTFNKMFR